MVESVSAGQSTRRRVNIVPHTHWDREWYSPFQTFRLRLVDLLDELLGDLEADPSYAHFMLDGQMAVVDDYLAVRPHAEEQLRRLAASGRLSVGPWYILMDEFLVSGETIVRDLQMGLAAATRFGGAMEVGYLPDMFGHVAQMPQLLAQFGLEHAVVWRGVPSAIDRSAFWWEAPDGSTVRAEYLPQGYGNGALVPDDAKALVRRIDEFAAEHGDLLTGPILWMNGTDHLMPQPWLGRVAAEANAIQDDYELRVTGLAEHLAGAPTEGLPRWQGELRSGARANLLMGVGSNRVDVKQAAARAERAIERLAEPMSALFLPVDRWPAALLHEAWLAVVRNAAHDSICACSVDEVCDAVLHRFAEATQIADGLADRALAALGSSIGGTGPVVVNPSARARGGLVEIRLPGDEAPPGTQMLRARPAERTLLEVDDVRVAAVMVAELEYVRSIEAMRIEDATGTVLVSAERDEGTLITPARRVQLRALEHDGPVRIVISQPPRCTVLARVEDVLGYGWQAWEPASTAQHGGARADGTALTNGILTVEVDVTDGTWSINGQPGYGRLVDDGDVGDTYNYCPPADDTAIDRPTTCSVEVLEDGPLRGQLRIRATYELPARSTALARGDAVPVEIVTTLELRAGEDVLRVTTSLDNRTRDHRLRAWFPLPEPASASRAECAFAVVERGLEAEGGPSEQGLPTFPSRRFVTAGGLTVAHEGLLEYELVDIRGGHAHALALTLLRCTGMLSRGPMTTRPLPAGPMTPIEGPQLQRPVEVCYALHVGGRNAYAVVDDAFVPLLVTAAGGGERPARGNALSITGAEVSAVQRSAGRLEVRVFNPSSEAATVMIEGRAGWLVDLRGRPLVPFESSFELAPCRLATVVLAEP